MTVAGYSCLVRKSGDSTAVTTEAMSLMSSSSVRFRVTDSAKRVIDPLAPFHVKNGTATVAYTDLASIDFMFGEFTFKAPVADGSATSLSFSGSYLPLTSASERVVEAVSFKLSDSVDLLGTDIFTGSTTDFVRRRIPGLRDISLDVVTLAAGADLADLQSALEDGTPVVTEVFFGSDAHPRFRGICNVEAIDRDAPTDARVESTVMFKISAVRDEVSEQVASVAYKVQ